MKRIRSALTVLLCALLAFAILLGPGWTDVRAAPVPGNTLRIAVKAAIVNMDGMRDGNITTNALNGHIVETLLLQNEQGNIVPNLATAWSVSRDDPTEWTVRLRPGVTFQDGSPFNATAVVASFRRLKNPEFKLPRGVQYYADLVSATAIDNMTVQFKTKEPWGVLPTFLTYIASGIVAPAVANRERIEVPIGTGAFKFAEWKPGELVRLVKNEKYWGEGPFVDEVIIYEVPEDGTRIAKLLAGEVDLITDVSPVEADRLRRTANITVRNDQTDMVMWLQFNTQRKPFDDLNVRKAVKFAIDISAITTGIMRGIATPADSFAAPGVFGYSPDPQYHQYSPETARELLAKAGYPQGFSTSVVFGPQEYPLQREMLTAVQAQLARVGIRLRLNPLEWAVYLSTLRKPLQETPVEINSWAWSSVVGDISFLIGANLMPERIPPSCCNTMFWSNKRVVDLFEGSQQATDANRRLSYLKAIQQVVNRELPQINLFVYRKITAQSSRLQGVIMPPNQQWRLGQARFRQ